MTCPQCQHENADDARLCSICGATLQEIDDDELTDAPVSSYRTPAGHEPPPLPHGGFGDIIHFTFAVYGAHLLPFILIALLSQIPLLIGVTMSLMGIGPVFVFDFPAPAGEEVPNPLEISLWVIIGVLLSYAITTILANGAIIYGTGRHFLGRPVLVRRSYEYAWARFPKLLGATMLFLLILIVPFVFSIFIIGIPLLIFAIVALLFVTHAVAIEQLGPTDAIRRSWNVVQGNLVEDIRQLHGYRVGVFRCYAHFLVTGRHSSDHCLGRFRSCLICIIVHYVLHFSNPAIFYRDNSPVLRYQSAKRAVHP